MKNSLPFEKSIVQLQEKIDQLVLLTESEAMPGVDKDIQQLHKKREKALIKLYKSLTPWQKTLVSRHPERPRTHDYIRALIRDFTPLSGDRAYGDDKAITSGLGWLGSRAVMVIGHEKGHDTQSRVHHNFGMAHPEGYRKATRLMQLASRFGLPVLTFIDTPGAYPGIEAEERGQAEAIARSTEACLQLEAPLITLVIGEGGSGGAVALASANRILMLEHSVYTVASPEAAASILWRDAAKAEVTAQAMRITAQMLHELGLVDHIIEEPLGGAHCDHEVTMSRVEEALGETLAELAEHDGKTLRQMRQDKFLAIGREKK